MPTTTDAIRAAIPHRHVSVGAVAKWFAYEHLPEGAPRDASHICATAAAQLLQILPDSPSLTVALRHLLVAKDEAVRAALDATDHPASRALTQE